MSRSKRDDRRHQKPPREVAARPDGFATLEGVLLAAVTCLLVVTPLVPSESTVAFGTNAPLVLLWGLALFSWAALTVLRPEGQVVVGFTSAAAAALIAVHVLSTFVIGTQGNMRQSLNVMWLWVTYGIAFFLLRQLLRSPLQCRGLAAVMLALAAVESSTGYYEYFVSKPALVRQFQEDPERVYREMGADLNTSSAQRTQLRWRLEGVEPIGTFALTNSLAGFLAPWSIVLVAIGWATLGRPGQSRTFVAVVLLAVLLAGCLILTKSRTAILATLGGLVLVALYGRASSSRIGWRIPVFAAGTLLLLGLGAVAVGGLDIQVLSEAPTSVLYRLQYWRATAAIIADHPLLGCGPGNFQEYYTRYKLPEASETVADPHNFLLEIWATAGTLAILAVLAMMAAFVWQLSRSRQLSDSASQRPALSPQPPASETRIPNPEPRLPRSWLYGGALAGLLLAFPLGAIVGYPPDVIAGSIPIIWLVGLPTGILSLWLLDNWVTGGQLPRAAPIIALVVLLVNLLGAGATTFPGVFGATWVLMAVALAQADTTAEASGPSWRWRPKRWAGLVLVLASLALLAAAVRTEVVPVLGATTHLRVAQDLRSAGRVEEAEGELMAAVSADRWSPEPWRQLAELHLQRLVARPDSARLDGLLTAAEEFRRRNPRHHGQFAARGNWFLLAWRHSAAQQGEGNRQLLDQAVEAYRGAVAWYPNSALHHAQLGWVLHLAGQPREAGEEVARALKLDAMNSHAEQKLAAQHLYDPRQEGESVRLFRPENAYESLENLRRMFAETNGPPPEN